MRLLNVLPAIFALTLSALIFGQTYYLTYYGETSPGPAFFPFWIAGLGVLLFVFELLDARRKGASTDAEWPSRSEFARVVLAFGALCLIPVLSPLIGMLVSCVLFMLFLLIAVLRQRLAPSLLTVAITAGLIDVIFVRWLGIALPQFSLGL
jgi:hypothetical protein